MFLIWVLCLWPSLGAAAETGPRELPPGDFSGAQYIDSQGCVYLRDGRHWRPRLDPEGLPVCGFPPSRSAWHAPDVGAGSDGLAGVEQALAVSIATAGLMAPPQTRGNALPVATPTGATSGDGIAEQLARASVTSGLVARQAARPNVMSSRLCELLGLSDASPTGATSFADPTGGHCAGGGVPLTLQKRAEVSTAAAAPRAGSGAKAGDGLPPKPRTTARPNAEASPAQRQQVAAKTSRQSRPPLPRLEIPASARYVQVGSFNEDGVAAAIAALHRLGYPVARQVKEGESGRRIVLAGPFASRERLISALDRLRRAGFGQAMAR
ncbi:SPOR domain-containing protein [Paracoccus jeotgali]|uniref:SPOR domain-containing protein n=1 Tax=Paracoccus jeotgali TaxID=2065379 RepID=UPI0028B0C4FA|nr:SPOR domain-containing protein [Paracoccus jeotgali]